MTGCFPLNNQIRVPGLRGNGLAIPSGQSKSSWYRYPDAGR
jgi:hypothetical protein